MSSVAPASPAIDVLDETVAKYGLPKPQRRGIGLCLSGGGYRATLFHLGALRRLNELGILTSAEFRTVSSVSGGSITAAGLATAFVRDFPKGSVPIPPDAWALFQNRVRGLTRRNIRNRPLVRHYLQPWNWLNDQVEGQSFTEDYRQYLTDLRLQELPEQPNFVFCATDLSYGVNWVFERCRVGDYQAGYQEPPPESWLVARAVAASACFPPVFQPMAALVRPEDLGRGKADGTGRDAAIRGMRLSDGGDYDNLGLEPVWKDHAVVLVSDAGGLFPDQPDEGLLWRIPRYVAILERQALALRQRWLISSFLNGALEGTYWGVGSSRQAYNGASGGYTDEVAKKFIANIRTDLDVFSDAEAQVLENHGYLLADVAIQTHVKDLLPSPVPALVIPYPAWMDEDKVRAALKDSGKRKLFA